LDSDLLKATPNLSKIALSRQSNSSQAQIADSSSQEHGQLFLRVHNGTVCVFAMRVQSESFARWNQSLIRGPTSSGLAEIVSDDIPVIYATDCALLLSTRQRQMI
jgi:hypothetical protein